MILLLLCCCFIIFCMNSILRFLSTIVVLGCFFFPLKPTTELIPVTKAVLEDSPSLVVEASDASLTSFISNVYDSNGSVVRGIYIKDVLQLPVVQQPASNPGFVSSANNTVTQFYTASYYGSIGLLAHNTLAGSYFFLVDFDDPIYVVYGDGHLETYKVIDIRYYQALSPNSPYSSFVNLANPVQTIGYEQLFYETYGVSGRLVMQTCVEKEGLDSWGRLFIIAEKIEG